MELSFEDLPADVFVHIVKWLADIRQIQQLRLVSHRVQDTVLDVMRELHLDDLTDQSAQDQVDTICRFPLVQTVVLHNYLQDLNNSHIRQLVDTCAELADFTVLQGTFRSRINDESLELLSRKEQLFRLRLDSCHQITSAGLKSLAAQCQMLRVLSLRGSSVSDDGIGQLASCCPLLEKLWLSRTAINGACFAALATHCAHLRTLDVSFTAATAENLKHLDSRLSRLKKVFLAETLCVEQLTAFAAQHPDLTRLTLPVKGLTDEIVLSVVGSCAKLLHLGMGVESHVTEQEVCKLCLSLLDICLVKNWH
eukprot:TRINITY_DN2173_c0_g1_i3.p1 TRINITY_DN2173_c0_g1~~TRINITY_DN2173_c0_g1_i3.p1  ORF type:complete len:309 (-),score=80.01 TRINITY_DN2173_c0_g1_i3:494-1420(-)